MISYRLTALLCILLFLLFQFVHSLFLVAAIVLRLQCAAVAMRRSFCKRADAFVSVAVVTLRMSRRDRVIQQFMSGQSLIFSLSKRPSSHAPISIGTILNAFGCLKGCTPRGPTICGPHGQWSSAHCDCNSVHSFSGLIFCYFAFAFLFEFSCCSPSCSVSFLKLFLCV